MGAREEASFWSLIGISRKHVDDNNIETIFASLKMFFVKHHAEEVTILNSNCPTALLMDRLRKLALKLGKPAPQAAAPNMPSAPAMVVPATRGRSVPGQPMMPPGYAYPPGFVPPGYPPGMVPGGYPPGVVPVTPVTPVFGR